MADGPSINVSVTPSDGQSVAAASSAGAQSRRRGRRPSVIDFASGRIHVENDSLENVGIRRAVSPVSESQSRSLSPNTSEVDSQQQLPPQKAENDVTNKVIQRTLTRSSSTEKIAIKRSRASSVSDTGRPRRSSMYVSSPSSGKQRVDSPLARHRTTTEVPNANASNGSAPLQKSPSQTQTQAGRSSAASSTGKRRVSLVGAANKLMMARRLATPRSRSNSVSGNSASGDDSAVSAELQKKIAEQQAEIDAMKQSYGMLEEEKEDLVLMVNKLNRDHRDEVIRFKSRLEEEERRRLAMTEKVNRSEKIERSIIDMYMQFRDRSLDDPEEYEEVDTHLEENEDSDSGTETEGNSKGGDEGDGEGEARIGKFKRKTELEEEDRKRLEELHPLVVLDYIRISVKEQLYFKQEFESEFLGFDNSASRHKEHQYHSRFEEWEDMMDLEAENRSLKRELDKQRQLSGMGGLDLNMKGGLVSNGDSGNENDASNENGMIRVPKNLLEDLRNSVDELHTHNQQLLKTVKRSETEIDRLSGQLSVVQASREKTDGTWQARLNQLVEDTRRVNQDKKQAEFEAKAMRSRSEKAEKELELLKQKLASLNRDLAFQKHQVSQLKSDDQARQLRRLQTLSERQAAEIRTNNESVRQLKTNIEKLQKDSTTLQHEYDKLFKSMRQAQFEASTKMVSSSIGMGGSGSGQSFIQTGGTSGGVGDGIGIGIGIAVDAISTVDEKRHGHGHSFGSSGSGSAGKSLVAAYRQELRSKDRKIQELHRKIRQLSSSQHKYRAQEKALEKERWELGSEVGNLRNQITALATGGGNGNSQSHSQNLTILDYPVSITVDSEPEHEHEHGHDEEYGNPYLYQPQSTPSDLHSRSDVLHMSSLASTSASTAHKPKKMSLRPRTKGSPAMKQSRKPGSLL